MRKKGRYLGAAETSLNQRYSDHLQDFKYKKYINCTKPSKYIWSSKDQGKALVVKWRIVKKC